MISAQLLSELTAAALRREIDAMVSKLNTLSVEELMELNHAAISLKATIGNVYHRKAVEYKESFK